MPKGSKTRVCSTKFYLYGKVFYIICTFGVIISSRKNLLFSITEGTVNGVSLDWAISENHNQVRTLTNQWLALIMQNSLWKIDLINRDHNKHPPQYDLFSRFFFRTKTWAHSIGHFSNPLTMLQTIYARLIHQFIKFN